MHTFIREIKATPEEARRLEKLYKLEFVRMNADNTATYNVFEKDDSDETRKDYRS